MEDEILIEIRSELKEINKNLRAIIEIQKDFPIQELLNPNGVLLSSINNLSAVLERIKM